MVAKRKCAVCHRGTSRGPLFSYPTLLLAMGYIGNPYAHGKCILKAQQRALIFRERLSR